jgi:hypothetical protein
VNAAGPAKNIKKKRTLEAGGFDAAGRFQANRTMIIAKVAKNERMNRTLNALWLTVWSMRASRCRTAA